jgi:hypothetical protein
MGKRAAAALQEQVTAQDIGSEDGGTAAQAGHGQHLAPFRGVTLAGVSMKAECPACKAYLSGVWDAMEYGGACPSCGLPGTAIADVYAARKTNAEKELLAKYEEAVIRAGRAEAERDMLRGHLEAIDSEMRVWQADEKHLAKAEG